MHFKADTGMKVLLPHWFDDCVTLGIGVGGEGGLGTEGYEWPEPRYLRRAPDDDATAKDKNASNVIKGELSRAKKKLLQSIGWNDLPPSSSSSPSSNIWSGRKILLSQILGLSPGRREAVEAGIRRAGGVVVDAEEGNEEERMEDADVFVTRFRGGGAYYKVRPFSLLPSFLVLIRIWCVRTAYRH